MSSFPLRWRSTRWRDLRLALCISLCSSNALSAPEDEARERAKRTLAEVEAEAVRPETFIATEIQYNPISLLAAAELHVQASQFENAILKLNKVIELRAQRKASQATEAEARYLLAEAYFATGELYSARREYNWVVQQASQERFSRFAGPAIGRLVDIALRVQRADDLKDILSNIDSLLANKSSDALRYARGKALFAMGRHEEAGMQAAEIKSDSEYIQRGYYLRGVALMRSAELQPQTPLSALAEGSADESSASSARTVDYAEAIESFLKATLSKDSPSQDEDTSLLSTGARRRQLEKKGVETAISDLAWLAVARLYYEQKAYIRASNAYGQLVETSEYYARALFELAWTYVRLGDYERVEKVLDVLSVLDPGLLDGADAALLRGDLFLRSGQYQRAEAAYEEVKGVYDPLRSQIDEYLRVTVDPAVYYDKLTATDIETGYDLPPLVIEVAREEAGENRVFAVVDDVARARRLVRESKQMIAVLQAALNTSVRAKVFPELLSRLRATVGLINRLSQAEASLARGFDEADNTSQRELLRIRKERQKLMSEIGQLPTTAGDFSIREATEEKKWQKLSQKLQRLELEADHLQAIVNSLHQVLGNTERYGLNTDAASLVRFRNEMEENEKDLSVYRERIKDLRRLVQLGRVQTGFGDETFQRDKLVRDKFAQLLEQETALSQKYSRGDEKSYVRTAAPVLKRVKVIRARLEIVETRLNAEAVSKGTDVIQLVREEAETIDLLEAKLDTLDQDARLLVGNVARDNFLQVRDRMRNVVMRADVGLVQHAWKIREKQQRRLRMLLRNRAREENHINDELREVLDDQEVN